MDGSFRSFRGEPIGVSLMYASLCERDRDRERAKGDLVKCHGSVRWGDVVGREGGRVAVAIFVAR